jgi:nucleoside-diphosphate-sugar epimerase
LKENAVRVFVLGGTGSIGSAVVQELIRRGHDVLALARSDLTLDSLGRHRLEQVNYRIDSPVVRSGRMGRISVPFRLGVQRGSGIGDA